MSAEGRRTRLIWPAILSALVISYSATPATATAQEPPPAPLRHGREAIRGLTCNTAEDHADRSNRLDAGAPTTRPAIAAGQRPAGSCTRLPLLAHNDNCSSCYTVPAGVERGLHLPVLECEGRHSRWLRRSWVSSHTVTIRII